MGRRRAARRKGRVTKRKAGKILRHGRARGKKLTARQKRFFGWVRGGRKPYARTKRARKLRRR